VGCLQRLSGRIERGASKAGKRGFFRPRDTPKRGGGTVRSGGGEETFIAKMESVIERFQGALVNGTGGRRTCLLGIGG